MENARSLLAIDVSPLGRSFALLPAMRALRASYPDAFVVAATCSGTSELLSAAGLADETIALGVIKSSERGRIGALRRTAKLIRRARRYNFDLVLDFSFRLETQLVSRLILRARTLTPSKLPRAIELLLILGGMPRGPAASDYETVVQQAGVVMPDTRLSVIPSSEEDALFERLLASRGSRGGELTALLYAADPAGRRGWPVGAFCEVGTRLANNFGARIIAADEPSDRAFTDAIGGLLPATSIKLAAPRALQLAAAIARASLVITDESAIAQLASELNTPAIEVAEALSDVAPMQGGHVIVWRSSRNRVSVDEVYDAACEMIQASRSPVLFRS